MIKPIFIHCRADSEYDDRYDTIMMPNGSVAALCQIVESLRSKNHQLLSPVAIDEQYLQTKVEPEQERYVLIEYLFRQIEALLEQELSQLFFALCSPTMQKVASNF